MAADFFERQDAARRNTSRLVVLFVLAVLATMASIHVVLAIVFGTLAEARDAGEWAYLGDLHLLTFSVVGTLLVVGSGSAFKTAQLSAGGRVVAEELGGRRLNPDTAGPAEQQLLNVVEEMAIASGTPVPPVYLLEEEEGINAFAAGFTPNDAVIGITRGALHHLTRDELQGVVAHEFSHILNGDMRLNIRLIGLLHGILIVGMLGYFILRATAFSGHRYRGSRREGNALPLLALGAGLMVVGFFGTFFGNMIKAAVSRQREFLADASAVQFTRMPEGIAGALKKIGALAGGSAIRSPNAPEASHMFFGRATGGLTGLFSTHPPLPERIRRIDPSWDGSLPEVGAAVDVPASAPAGGAFAFAAAESAGATRDLHRAVDRIGQPGPAHLQYAAGIRARLPPRLVSAAHEAYGGRALVYALLVDRDADLRRRQLEHLASAADPHVVEETLALLPIVAHLDVQLRLPLLEMTLPALGALTRAEHERFRRNVAALATADAAISPFEWALYRILVHDLDRQRGDASPPRVRHHTVTAVQGAAEVLLSVLAHTGARDAGAAQQAFEQGRERLGLRDARLRRFREWGGAELDAALAALDEAAPRVKREVLAGLAACVSGDREVTATEAELVRAIAAALGCPMPPLLDDERAG